MENNWDWPTSSSQCKAPGMKGRFISTRPRNSVCGQRNQISCKTVGVAAELTLPV